MRWTQVGGMIWPEAIVAGSVGIAHVFSRVLDARLGLDQPFRRTSDWLHALALGGGALGVAGTREGTVGNQALRALVISDVPLLTESLAATIVEELIGRRALTPAGWGALQEAEETARAAAARHNPALNPARRAAQLVNDTKRGTLKVR